MSAANDTVARELGDATFIGWPISLDWKSVRLHRALDRGAQHQPALGRGKIGARVRRAAVVPQEQVADPPDMLVGELRFLGLVEDRLEQRRALCLRHVEDG